MSYELEKVKVNRKPIRYCEIDFKKCAEVNGVGSCTANRTITGTAAAGSNNTITLDGSASAVDDTYNGQVAYISGGTGSGQTRVISDYVGSTKAATVTEDWDTNPDVTSTYTIIDRPNACRNTRKSCQDPVNFNGTATLTIRLSEFTLEQLGIPAIPCIEKISTAHSVIEPGQESTGKSAALAIQCKDLPYHDRGIDPYVSTRTYVPEEQGTLFGKLKAANPYYQGAEVRVYSGYLTDTYSVDNFKKKTYFLEKFDGPDLRGNIKFIAQDIMRRLSDDRVTYPEQTDGKLTATLAVGTTTSFTVSGDEDKYDTANGAVRINDEVIRYTTGLDNGDGTFTFSTLTRGSDNTEADEHELDDAVQKCVEFVDELPRDIAYTLYTEAGISASYLDTTQWDVIADRWLQKSYSRLLTKPTGIDKLLGECHVQMNFFTWWDEETSKVQLEAIRPPDFGTATYTQASHFKRGTIEVLEKTDKRITQVRVHYNAKNPVEGNEPEHFKRRVRNWDIGAEGDDQYGDSRIREIYATWITDEASAALLAGRMVDRFRDNIRMLKVKMDAKDDALKTGDQFYADTDALQDLDGSSKPTLFQVVQRDEIESGSVYAYRAWELFYFGRYMFIGAAGSPNYGSATNEQKNTIGYISSAGGGDYSDGGAAHKII